MYSFFRQKITLFSRDTAVLWGIYAVGIVFIALFFLDAVLFTTQRGEKEEASPPSLPDVISRQDIENVIDALERRQQRFQKILDQK
ncbi:MAG: hypothetical protein HYZ69_00785 [Candidatus Colwellbacteria bacterium]|nr:hypothetical protein [Candidatus Colwellbacteria bacterium]